jgi:hypothetical protein
MTKVAYGIQRVEGALPALLRLAQGGTAVGTGLNTKKGYDVAVARQVRLFRACVCFACAFCVCGVCFFLQPPDQAKPTPTDQPTN